MANHAQPVVVYHSQGEAETDKASMDTFGVPYGFLIAFVVIGIVGTLAAFEKVFSLIPQRLPSSSSGRLIPMSVACRHPNVKIVGERVVCEMCGEDVA